MDAIIMCAGLGTRMRPLTESTPKPLVPILGKGSLLRTLEILPDQVTRVILVVGYLADIIHEAIGTEWQGRPVIYVVQDPLDGTGGCLRQVKARVGDLTERFLVLNGDDLYAASDLLALAGSERGVLTFKTRLPKEEDAWALDDSGRLLCMKRQPAGDVGRINAGAYCLDHSWFSTAPVLSPNKTSEWSLPHAIPELLERGLPFAAVDAAFWMPVGSLEELARAEQALR